MYLPRVRGQFTHHTTHLFGIRIPRRGATGAVTRPHTFAALLTLLNNALSELSGWFWRVGTIADLLPKPRPIKAVSVHGMDSAG